MIHRRHWSYLCKSRNLLLLAFASYCFVTVFLQNTNVLLEGNDVKGTTPTERPIKPDTRGRSNIIINSYMRGGSSFVGRLFGFHPDAFYIYEPLWKYGIWDYFQEGNVKTKDTTCGISKSTTGSKLLRKLIIMNSCKGLKDVTSPKMTDFYSGKQWENFTMCYCKQTDPLSCKIRSAPKPCYDVAQKVCSQKAHTVSKVLRLTVGMYKTMLDTTNNTKILHLFRDPRATMNSRITTKWYPAKTEKEIKQNSKCLCKRMLTDYEAGLKLQASYPSRFKIVFYEDLVDNLETNANTLYDFVDMRRIESFGLDTFNYIADFGYKTDHSLRDNSTDYTSWWRTTLDWNVVQGIDTVCSEVYTRLGYKKFDTERDFRNKSQPSFSTQKLHKL